MQGVLKFEKESVAKRLNTIENVWLFIAKADPVFVLAFDVENKTARLVCVVCVVLAEQGS